MPERGPHAPCRAASPGRIRADRRRRTSVRRAAPGLARSPSRRTGLLVTLILGGLTATPPLAMDMYLPSLPEVTDSLHAPAATVQLTLTACLAGMALGQLVVGPMSDRWGRRRPLLAGLVVYVVATALCAFAPTAGAPGRLPAGPGPRGRGRDRHRPRGRP